MEDLCVRVSFLSPDGFASSEPKKETNTRTVAWARARTGSSSRMKRSSCAMWLKRICSNIRSGSPAGFLCDLFRGSANGAKYKQKSFQKLQMQ